MGAVNTVRDARRVYRAARGRAAGRGDNGGNGNVTRNVTRSNKPSLPGYYSGKFKKPTKKGLQIYKAQYAGKGFVKTFEVAGSIADPDCCYITHTTVVPWQTIQILVESLVRKLLRRATGFNCTNAAQEIPGYSFDDTNSCFQFRLITKNIKTGVYSTVGHQTVNDDTVITVANTFFPTFRQFAEGSTNDNDLNVFELERFQMYQQDQYGTGLLHWRFIGELNLKKEYVHFFATSEMKIQNRSLSASGSADIDTVNNNPLIGRVYDFKGGVPRSRTEDARVLERVRDNGVNLVRAAELPDNVISTQYVNSYREPPMPKLFYNCSASAKIKLDPGQVKYDKLKVEYHMPMYKFLRKLRDPTSNGVGGTFYAWLIGKSRMYALEDMLNVNVANNIQLAYEVNREIGLYTTTSRPDIAQASFSQTTFDNNPPA